MVKIFRSKFSFEHPWSDVTMAHWLKYPNPFAAHVITSDVVDRRVENGILYSTRLFLKTGTVPKWGLGILKSPQAFILEESTVDPVRKVMETKTRNLSHAGIMFVEEVQIYQPHPDNTQEWTQVSQESRIVSDFGWGLASRIENFGIRKLDDNTKKSKRGMKWVLEHLTHRQPMQPHQQQ